MDIRRDIKPDPRMTTAVLPDNDPAPASASALPAGVARAIEDMLAAEREDRHDDAEIVAEGLDCWIGMRRTNHATLRYLLQHMMLSEIGPRDRLRRYRLNSLGRLAARDASVVDIVREAVLSGHELHVVDDQVIALERPAR